jgi:hypothetical protein
MAHRTLAPQTSTFRASSSIQTANSRKSSSIWTGEGPCPTVPCCSSVISPDKRREERNYPAPPRPGWGDRCGGNLKGLASLPHQGGVVLPNPAYHWARRRLVNLDQDAPAPVEREFDESLHQVPCQDVLPMGTLSPHSSIVEVSLTRFDGHPSSGVVPGRMSDYGKHG